MHRPNTILTAAMVISQAVVWAQTQSTSPAAATSSADQVSFYTVPLACPAARGLGCGSAAKPVLLALEKRSGIKEAWLDHAGTTLAIVWKREVKADERSAEIQSAADDRVLALHERQGKRRD